jgi:antitoxin (DNA-binding transcriptional repressor) of toxin-antitoxin stability system
MQKIALKEAKKKLAEIIGLVAIGEDIIITKEDGSAYKIVPVPKTKPYPKFGSAKGLVEMSDDFDEPLEDFEDYIP